MYSVQRDNSWLDHPDIAYRLHRGRAFLRSAVRAVFADSCVVDWSSPRAPFHGVMVRALPLRILVNPLPVIQHQGERTDALALSLLGIALHEASHAMHTSPRWPTVLRQRRRLLERKTGRKLPDTLLSICANLAEDVWIEDRLAADYPGFAVYFEVMRLYLFPDAQCTTQIAEMTQLWSAYLAAPASFSDRDALTASCVNAVILLANRPDVVWELPAGLEVLRQAAQMIQDAGKKVRISARLAGAVAAADRIYELVCQWMCPSAGGSAGEGTAPMDRADEECATAEAVERAIGQRETPLRLDGNPRGKSPAEGAKSRKLTTWLREMEEIDRRERLAEETLDVQGVVVAAILEHEAGQALCGNKTVRIVDSAPETLYRAEDWELGRLAADLMAANQEQAQRFRRDFARLLQSETQFTVRGLTQGEPDEDALADLVMGNREVLQQTHMETTVRLDLTLLIDESGSMDSVADQGNGRRWQAAGATAVLLEYALQPHFGGGRVRLRIYGYTSDCFADGETLLYRHFDSAIPRLNRPQALGWCYPKFANTDGIALAGIRRELLKTRLPGQELALLMISDGQPSGIGYEGPPAYEHVRLEVEETIRCRIRFAHLQIGPTPDKILQQMYDARWQRVSQGADLVDHVAALAGNWFRR
jgi:hypothetical protein